MWTLAPLPIAFALLGLEFLFRMYRLYCDRTRRGAKTESAVTAA
jgi:TRAP-type C4-dicarboxylate transport system permease small subunit